MGVPNQELHTLVDFVSDGYLVTSFYLDVNADEFPAPEHIRQSANSALHRAGKGFKERQKHLSHEAAESLRHDLHKIGQFVNAEFQRDGANGLAIFSCSARELWQVFRLPTKVQTRVVFESQPYVAPLATFFSHAKPTGILLTDRQHARILTMDDGKVTEWADFGDFVPQRSDQGGWSQMRYQRRSDEWAKHHLDHAARLVLQLEQHQAFDWLVLGTEVDVEHDLAEDLHPYVKDRVIGRIHVRIDAPEAEVVEAARKVRDLAEKRLIDRLMRQIQDYEGASGRGALGLDDTLRAVSEQKVHILVVQEGYRQAGAVCPQCRLLLGEWRDVCPACNIPAERVDNVVDSAIQRAFELGSVVEVATEYQQLAPIQWIGAILYY
jgi:peptide chain release factor subunit 1